MKLSRPIILIPAASLALVALAVGVLTNPAVQRWSVERWAARHPEHKLRINAISAGFSGCTLEGLQGEYAGIKFQLRRVETRYSLVSWLLDDHFDLADFHGEDLLIDATTLSPGEMPAVLAAPGRLLRLDLPWAVTASKLQLDGQIRLPASTGITGADGTFRLLVRDLAPGREGEAALEVRLFRPTPSGTPQSLNIQSLLRYRETFGKSIEGLSLSTVVEGHGPGLPSGAKLHVQGKVSRTAAGETYGLHIGTAPDPAAVPLLAVTAAPTAAQKGLTGEWRLDVRSGQLEPFLLGYPAPDFLVNGEGRFTFAATTPSFVLSAQGRLQGRVADLGRLHPEFRAVEPLKFSSAFDCALENELLRCSRLDFAVEGVTPILALRTVGVPVFDLGNHRLAPTGVREEELLRLEINALPVSWLAPWLTIGSCSGEPLRGAIRLTRGENDQLRVSTVGPLQTTALTFRRAEKTWIEGGELQLAAEATWQAERVLVRFQKIALTTAAGDRLSADFTLNYPLATGTADWSAEGQFTADLPALLQAWQPGLALKGKGELALAAAGGKIQVRRCALEATDPADTMVALVHLVHPFDYDPATGFIVSEGDQNAKGETVLVSVRLGQLPQLTLMGPRAGTAITGRPSPLEALVSTAAGKLIVRTSAPVPIMDFTVTEKKRVLLDRLKLTFRPELLFAQGQFMEARSGEIVVLSATEAPLAGLKAELTRTAAGWRAASSFTLDVPAWATQPVLFGREVLSAGEAVGEVRAAITDELAQVEARATFNSMVVLDGGQLLPVANLTLKASVDAVGRFDVSIPVLLDRAGRRSDLNFSANGEIRPTGLAFTGAVKSEHLEFPDLLLFLAATGSSLAGEGAGGLAAQGRALSPPPADLEPFWTGYEGTLQLECGQLAGRSDWLMRALHGRLEITADGMRLEKLEAMLGEQGGFKANGSLGFSDGLEPYTLAADFTLRRFDLGRHLRALQSEAPVLEGLFAVQGRLRGHGLTFDDTVDRTGGTFEFSGTQGVFRGLKRSTDKVSMTTKAVDLMSVIIGEKAEKMAGDAFFVDQLAQDFGELKFDRTGFVLVHEPRRELRVEQLSLVTPELEVRGAGRIDYEPDRSWLEMPLSATLHLSARGKLEAVYGKLDQLEATRDPLGFVRTKTPVTLWGTLARPQANRYFADLAGGKLAEALERLLAPRNGPER